MRDKEYDTAGIALQLTLGAALGRQFTPAVRDAWAACYAAITGEMKSAAAAVQAREELAA